MHRPFFISLHLKQALQPARVPIRCTSSVSIPWLSNSRRTAARRVAVFPSRRGLPLNAITFMDSDLLQLIVLPAQTYPLPVIHLNVARSALPDPQELILARLKI